MRTKILGLIGLALALALVGSMSLKSEQADAAVTGVTLSGGVGGVFTWTVALTDDEADTFTLNTSLLPAGATAIFSATCTSNGAPVGACGGTASGAGTGGALPTFNMSAVQVAATDTDPTVEAVTITGTLTVTGAPTGTNVTVTVTSPSLAVGITSPPGIVQAAVLVPALIGTPACALPLTPNEVRVCKVNQNGVALSATFALVGPAGPLTPSGTTIQLVTSGSAAANLGTCITSQTNGCSRVLNSNLGLGSPGSLGIAALPAGTWSLQEITGPGGSIQIQIINGLGQLMPPGAPLTVVTPCASAAACTFLFTNSQPLAGAANAAGSSVVAVIGGSSFGLSNRTNIEIAPAAGSDDDARIDIRVRDSSNIEIRGAHVTVMTDKGRLAMRQDIIQTPGITGYDVIEPSAPNFGSNASGDPCDLGIGLSGTTITGATFNYPYRTGSEQIQDGFTNDDGIVSACLFVSDDLVPGITPGRATITVIIENQGNFGPGTFGFYGSPNLVLTQTVTVVGPPASVKVAASPTSVQCGEKATITATITDSVGQNVSDHTRVELVSNFGATIGGTGSTLGFPGQGSVNPISSSAAETFSGVATAFLLTSTEHVGPYEVVIATGGSTGGGFNPGGITTFINPQTGLPANVGISSGIQNYPLPILQNPTVFGGSGVFSTAPVSAQVTVTCSLPVVAVPVAPAAAAPIRAPITGEGIRPPNTGDAGLAADNGSSSLFIVGGLIFALAGVATLKAARR